MKTTVPRLAAVKSQELAERLRAQIAAGELRPGDRLPTFVEMRARHGSLPATTERVYNLLEQEGLIDRIKGSGVYVAAPDEPARHGIVGFYAPGVDDFGIYPYWSRFMDGMHRGLAHSDAEILLLRASSREAWERVDGIIALGEGAEHLLDRMPIKIPFVTVMAGIPGVPGVVTDDFQGANTAVRHLLSLGHRRIAHLSDAYLGKTPISALRRAGYEAALRAYGIEPQSAWYGALRQDAVDFRERARLSMNEWLAKGWLQTGCTAILAQNDRVALGIVEVFRAAGIAVPGDVSVVGFDSTAECELCLPRLTSVAVPLENIAHRAMDLLLAQINEQPPRDEILVLPTHLDVRDSTTEPKN